MPEGNKPVPKEPTLSEAVYASDLKQGITYTSDQSLPSAVNPTVTHMTKKQLDSYKGYDINFSPYLDWNSQRAQNQEWGEEALNGLGRILAKVPATVLQNFATLADSDAIASPDPDLTRNAMYDALEEYKQGIDEALPIYRENPNESFNFGDSAWWFENISGVTESAAAFVITSYLTGGALGRVFTGAARGGMMLRALGSGRSFQVAQRMANILTPRLSGVVKGAGGLANAALTNHMEGFGVAMQTMKSAKQLALNQGKTEEEANKIAAESAALAYNTNRVNIFLNLTSAGAFVTAPRHTRQLLKQMTAKNTLKRMGLEGIQEGLEEEVNFIAQKRGEAYAEGKRYGTAEAFNDAISSEGLESAFWGAIGGIGQTALTGASNMLPLQRDPNTGQRTSKLRTNNQKWMEQQQVLEQYDAIANAQNIATATTAFQNAAEINETFQEIQDAVERGDDEAADALRNKLVDGQAYQAFEQGTTDKLIELYEVLRDDDPVEGMETNPESDTYYKKKAQDAIDRINKLEKEYVKSGQFVNGKEVFTNRANRDTLSTLVSGKRQVVETARAQVNDDVLQAQERGAIPKEYTLKELDLDVTETVAEGVKIADETIKNTQIPIVIDPQTMEVVPDMGIPQAVIEEVNAKVQGLDSYKEFKEASNEYENYQNNIQNLDLEHEYMTSNAVQEELIAQEAAALRAYEEAKKEAEAKKKADRKTNKRNNAAAKINADEAIDSVKSEKKEEAADAGFFQGEDLGNPNENFEDDPTAFDEPVDMSEETAETGQSVGSTADEKIVDDEKTQGTFMKQTVREIDEAERLEYSDATDKLIPNTLQKTNEKVAEDFSNRFQTDDGTISHSNKPTYAPNLLAYLARDYVETFRKDKDGKIIVERNDINDELRENLDLSLATEIFPGADLELRTLDDDDIEMYNPFFNQNPAAEPKTITWGVLKARLSANEINQYIPIGAYFGGKTEPSAYVHNYDWINSKNVDAKTETLQDQRQDLMEIRNKVVTEGATKSTIVSKGNGALIYSHDGSEKSVADALPDKDLKFAVVRNGELVSGNSTTDRDLRNVNVVNMDALKEMNGMFVSIVPLAGNQAKLTEGTDFVAVPMRRNKLGSRYANSITKAIEIWYRASNENSTAEDMDALSKMEGLDVRDFASLRDYVRGFVNVQFPQSDDLKNDMLAKVAELGNKSTVRLVGIEGNSIYWAKGGSSTVEFINFNTDAAKFQEKLGKLKSHLEGMHLNVDIGLEMEGRFSIPIIEAGDGISWTDGTYQDFIKENSRTNMISFQDKNGKYVYTIQHTLGFESTPAVEGLTEGQKERLSETESGEEIINIIEGDQVQGIGAASGITLNPLEFGDEDDFLDAFDDLVDEEVYGETKSLIEKFYVPGLTTGRSKDLIMMLVNNINKSVIEAIDGNKDVLSKADVYKDFENLFKKTLAAAKEANANTVPTFEAIVNNWTVVKKLTDKQLKRLGTIEMTDADIDVESFIEFGGNLERTNYDDAGSLSINSKKTASANLKRFLTNVRDFRDVGIPKKGLAGMDKYVPFDEVWNTVTGLLAGSKPDLDTQIKTLKRSVKSMPWLQDVVDKLEDQNLSHTIKAEFAGAMAKHYLDMRAVLWKVDDNGAMTLTVAPVNANAVGKEIQRKWKEGIKDALFVPDPEDSTEFVIDPEKAKTALTDYKNLNKSDPNAAFAWLESIGVELSPRTQEAFQERGLYYSNRERSYESMFQPGGVFDLLQKEILRHQQTGKGLNKGKLVSSTSIKALSVLEAVNSSQHFASSFRDGEDKTRYSYTQNKYLINRARDLKENAQVVENLLDVPFNEDGIILNELAEAHAKKDSILAENFGVFYLDTLKEDGTRKRGTVAARQTKGQLEQARLGLFQNTGTAVKNRSNQRITNIAYPTTSDKKIPYAVTMIAHDTKMGIDGSILDETVQAVYDAVVVPEIKRIKAVQANPDAYNIKAYGQGGQQFLFLPELNGMPSLWEDGILKTDILTPTQDMEPLRREIRDVVRSYLTNAIEDKMAEWTELGIGRPAGKNFTGLDKSYMNLVKKPKGHEVRYAAADFIVNSMIGNAEIFKTFIGDPAVYYKVSKTTRQALANATLGDPETSQAFIDAARDTFDNVGKRLAGDVAPGTELYLDPNDKQTYTTAFIADAEVDSAYLQYYKDLLGDDLGSKYASINAADAQEFTTLKEHLFVMKGLGKIGNRKYQDLVAAIDKQGDDFVMTAADKALILQPMKPVYVANQIETPEGGSAVDTRIYIKSSSFPLLPEFTKGTTLDRFRKAMEKQGIDRLAFESATKVGMTKQTFNPWQNGIELDENGDFAEGVFEGYTKELNRKDFRIQQEVPYKKDKDKVNDGTQQRKLLFSNLLDVAGFKYKDKKYKGDELFEEYNNIYDQIFKESYDGFRNEIYPGGVLDVKKFQKMLFDEAVSQNYPENDILALSLNDEGTDFRVPLWSSMSANKFEALLNGIVDSRIRNQKVKGNSFVLGTEIGTTPLQTWDSLPDNQKNRIVYSSQFDPKKGLQARDKDGFAQILVANKIKGANGRTINLKNFIKDGMLDMEKLPAEVLEGFGYRIPTQGLNSMSKVRIAGFLPTSMGDLIIGPKEWVAQMGSDFDIDKIFINFHNTIEVDGKIQKAVEGRKGMENDLLDVHLAVLSNDAKEVQAQVANPLGFGLLKDDDIDDEKHNLARTIDALKPKSGAKFNPLSPTYQRDRYMNAVAGKDGTGVFSLDSTLNASMQGKDISFEGVDPRVITFGVTSNGDLSGITTLTNKNRYKSDVIAAYQSAAVDNEKEQILDKLNINSETFDTIRILNQLGFEEDVVTSFINQPIVIDYVNEVKRMKASGEMILKPENMAFEIIRDQYNERAESNWFELGPERQDEIREKATGGYDFLKEHIISRGKDAHTQIALLEKFDKLREMGAVLKNLQTVINTDSAGVGPSIIENLEKESRILQMKNESAEAFSDEGIDVPVLLNGHKLIGEYSVSDPQDDSFMKRMYQTKKGMKSIYVKPNTINGFAAMYGLATANDLATRFYKFGPRETLTQEAFKEVEKLTGASTDVVSAAKKRMRIWKDVKKYMYSNMFSDTPQADRLELFYDTNENESLAKRIRDYQKMPMFRGNTFIQRLETSLGQGVRPSTVRYNASAVENEDESAIYGGFIELVADDRAITPEYSTRDLADDLVRAAFLEGGIQEASQYVRYVPASYILRGSFMDRINAINFRTRELLGPTGNEYYEVSQFAKQYVQSHPWEATMITSEDFKGKPGDKMIEPKSDWLAANTKSKQLPVFIQTEYAKGNKRAALYQLQKYKGEDGGMKTGYMRVDVIGTRGMDEFSMQEDVQSTIGTQEKFVYGEKNEPGIPANMEQVPFPTEQDAPQEAYGGPRNVNTRKILPVETYGIKRGNTTLSGPQTAVTVLDNIRDKSDRKFNQYLAQELKPIAERMGISLRLAKGEKELINNVTGKTAAGRSMYSPSTVIINQYKNSNKTNAGFEHTVLHEMVHQVTRAGVEQGVRTNSAAVQGLEGVVSVFRNSVENGDITLDSEQRKFFNYIFAKPQDRVRTLQEFTAFAMSNSSIQKLLAESKYRNGNESFFDKLKAMWGKLLQELGIKDPNNLLAPTLGFVLDMANETGASGNVKTVSETKADRLNDLNAILGMDSVQDKLDDLGVEFGEVSLSLQPLAEAGLINLTEDSILQAITKNKIC